MQTPHSPSRNGNETVPSYAWVVLLAVFIASVAAPINQFKVPPVMPALITEFGLTMTLAGLLMSIFSFAGLVLAFPAGAILAKLGPRKTCIVALAAIIGGSYWGSGAGTADQLLASRTFEGAGMAILGVCAPVIISAWFPPNRRGLPLGIWSAWVSTGVIVMMNASPLVTPAGEWMQTWQLGTWIAMAALALFYLLYRKPPQHHTTSETNGPSMKAMFGEALRIRDVWLISIALFCFNIMVLAMGTFFPTFLVKAHGLGMKQADFYASLPNMVMLLSCPLGGWIADKTGARKAIFSSCLALIGIWWLVIFHTPVAAIPLLMGVFGLLAGPIITTIITAMPDAVKRPELLGFGMALLMFWHHLGECIGPLYFGEILDMTGSWPTAGAYMIPICLLGGLAGWLMKVR